MRTGRHANVEPSMANAAAEKAAPGHLEELLYIPETPSKKTFRNSKKEKYTSKTNHSQPKNQRIKDKASGVSTGTKGKRSLHMNAKKADALGKLLKRRQSRRPTPTDDQYVSKEDFRMPGVDDALLSSSGEDDVLCVKCIQNTAKDGHSTEKQDWPKRNPIPKGSIMYATISSDESSDLEEEQWERLMTFPVTQKKGHDTAFSSGPEADNCGKLAQSEPRRDTDTADLLDTVVAVKHNLCKPSGNTKQQFVLGGGNSSIDNCQRQRKSALNQRKECKERRRRKPVSSTISQAGSSSVAAAATSFGTTCRYICPKKQKDQLGASSSSDTEVLLLITPPSPSQDGTNSATLLSRVPASPSQEIVGSTTPLSPRAMSFTPQNATSTNNIDESLIIISPATALENQLGTDEVLARRLQMEMDQEYAAHVASRPLGSSRSRPEDESTPIGDAIVPHRNAQSAAELQEWVYRRIGLMSEYEWQVHQAVHKNTPLPSPPPPGSREAQLNIQDILDLEVLSFMQETGGELRRGAGPGLDATDQHWQHAERVAWLATTGPSTEQDSRHRWSTRNQQDQAVHQAIWNGQLLPARRTRSNRQVQHVQALVDWDRHYQGNPLGHGRNSGQGYRRGRSNVRNARNNDSFSREGDDYEQLLILQDSLGEVVKKGVSHQLLESLPTHTYRLEEENVQAECSVCMCDFVHGDTQRFLPCFHSFHSGCIDKWLKDNSTCPICRVEVKID